MLKHGEIVKPAFKYIIDEKNICKMFANFEKLRI